MRSSSRSSLRMDFFVSFFVIMSLIFARWIWIFFTVARMAVSEMNPTYSFPHFPQRKKSISRSPSVRCCFRNPFGSSMAPQLSHFTIAIDRYLRFRFFFGSGDSTSVRWSRANMYMLPY